MNRILTILLLSLLSCSLRAQTWVSQSGSGNNSGSDTNNKMPIATYNSSGSGSVNLVGVLTTGLTATSGTIYFEPGAKFSAPTWGWGIITGTGGITIDGGVNGLIEATANGTGMTYSNSICAIALNNCKGVVVKNLTVQNMYVYQGPSDEQPGLTGSGSAVFISGNSSNITITNCLFHDSFYGIFDQYTSGCSNIVYSHCVAYNCNWGGGGGGGTYGGTYSGDVGGQGIIVVIYHP
jgi:hypothetical protein